MLTTQEKVELDALIAADIAEHRASLTPEALADLDAFVASKPTMEQVVDRMRRRMTPAQMKDLARRMDEITALPEEELHAALSLRQTEALEQIATLLFERSAR